jgi:hypothetical protein
MRDIEHLQEQIPRGKRGRDLNLDRTAARLLCVAGGLVRYIWAFSRPSFRAENGDCWPRAARPTAKAPHST